MIQFDAKEYWEKRLEQNFNLHGVGYQSLGVRYNQWMYRVRAQIFEKKVAPLVREMQNVRVLDVGSGTGFYIGKWKETGVLQLAGSDLTSVAVEKLRAAYPAVDFYQLDIGTSGDVRFLDQFDVISAFDVLFHIVDDSKFSQALKNIYSLLKPGGMFIWSDNFVHQESIKITHQVSRSLSQIETALEQTGFQIVERFPMFYLMNTPVDTRSIMLKKLWGYFTSFISLSELFGQIAGAVLYPLELWLTASQKESPTTELMICKRIRSKG